MSWTKGRILSATVIVLGACAGDGIQTSQTEQAATAPAARFHPSSVQGKLNSNFVPAAVDRTPVSVVAFLDGKSVAEAQADAGRKLSRFEKNVIKAQRAAEQVAPRAGIEAAGGRVTATFQSAMNGVKVTIPKNQVDSLRRIAGVVAVKPVLRYDPENFLGVQRIQANIAWSGPNGVHGEGMKVAIIDTGIDYTHADFGGPGTVAAYQAALATDTADPDPALFGPAAPKVKGGTDLVGDDYDANDPTSVPVPDNNPLDCNGHGSHVAGTAVGFGVDSTGHTYPGPYDQTTHSQHAFIVGPGVAPLADLYSVRVFGCSGSTNVVNEAIEWAVDHDMDVINMSLGSSYGPPDSADAVAADNAVKAGLNVAISAGNAGDPRYILGSPGSSTRSITSAASDDPGFIRMANLAIPAVPSDPNARTLNAINANGANFASPTTYTALVLTDPNGAVSLGCDPAQFVAQGAAGKIVVVQRGVCARVAKAINGQKAGAAAVVMINNATTLPPFEGPIVQNPDNGEIFPVSIPFFGVAGTVNTANSSGFFLKQRNGAAITVTEGTPVQTGTAGFSSGGPRDGDGALKPDITSPGVNIASAGVGTGNGNLVISGTSMASPHTAGTAALVQQAHPNWKPAAVKAAIVNGGNPDGLADYIARRNGTGENNAAAAVGTDVYAFGDKDLVSVSFGLEEFSKDFSDSRTITLHNDGPVRATFDISVEHQSGQPHTVSLNASSVSVNPHSEKSIHLTLNIPAATAGDSSDFRDVAGIVKFTPQSVNNNHGIALRVPYYLVSRVSANVETTIPAKLRGTPPSGVATVTNKKSAIPATAEFYTWGLESPKDASLGNLDLRAAGVESLDAGNGDRVLVFAINTFQGWSSINTDEFDILIDNDGDGAPDFDVFGIDLGLVTVGTFTGEYTAVILDIHTGALSADFDAVAATDSSTLLLPVFASSVGVTAATPRFSYTGSSNNPFDSSFGDSFAETATFNAFTPAITNGDFVTVQPNANQFVVLTIDPAEAALSPFKGVMIVSPDNKNGGNEADLEKVRF